MSLADWWSRRGIADPAVVLVVLIAYGVARRAGMEPVVVLDGPGRSAIYSALVPAGGSVLAFVVVPAAIVLAIAPGRRLAYLLKEHPGDLQRATVWGASMAIATMAAAIVGLAIDTGAVSHRWLEYVVVLTAGCLGLAALRMIYLFSVLLSNIGQDRKDKPDFGPLQLAAPDEAAGVKVVKPHRAS